MFAEHDPLCFIDDSFSSKFVRPIEALHYVIVRWSRSVILLYCDAAAFFVDNAVKAGLSVLYFCAWRTSLLEFGLIKKKKKLSATQKLLTRSMIGYLVPGLWSANHRFSATNVTRLSVYFIVPPTLPFVYCQLSYVLDGPGDDLCGNFDLWIISSAIVILLLLPNLLFRVTG